MLEDRAQHAPRMWNDPLLYQLNIHCKPYQIFLVILFEYNQKSIFVRFFKFLFNRLDEAERATEAAADIAAKVAKNMDNAPPGKTIL